MAMNNSSDQGAQVTDFASPLPPTLYWDASFVVNSIYERANWHDDCAAFMARLAKSETVSFVSTLALDEIWFSLLQLLIGDDYPDKPFWRVVNDDPSVIVNYIDRLENITNDIYANSQVRVVSVGSRMPLTALTHMRQFHFLPRDAMHLATMRQYELTHIVTTDADFLPVTGITLHTCNPALSR